MKRYLWKKIVLSSGSYLSEPGPTTPLTLSGPQLSLPSSQDSRSLGVPPHLLSPPSSGWSRI